jgi:arylsulfatase A-like enzyme
MKPYSPADADGHSWDKIAGKYAVQQQTLKEGRAPFWGATDEPEQEFAPYRLARDGIEFLNEFANARDRNAFCLTLSFASPHFPHYLPSRLADEARKLSVDLPETLRDPLNDRSEWHAIPWWPSMDARSFTEDEWRTLLQFGQRHMMAVDESIGQVLDALAAADLEETTTLLFLADHGDTNGTHGFFDKGAYFYDEVWRIPFIAAGPLIDRGARSQYVSIADIGATIFDLVGATPARLTARDGRSVQPLLLDPNAPGHDESLAFGRYDSYNGMSFAVRAVRDERYTYVWNPQGVDELYDHDTDPYERINRVHDVELGPVRRRLESALDSWMADLHDDLPARSSELPVAGTVLATGGVGP